MQKGKLKILLVEDDTNLGFLLLEFLESQGFDVKLYRDGESGLNGFRNQHFDFCILDIMLPKLDGYTLAKKIKVENSSVPMIFLTSKSFKEDKLKGFNIGADDYVTKPFDEDELLCRINAILNRTNTQESENRETCFEIGKYMFDSCNQSLIYEGSARRLTLKENDIFRLLCMNQDKIVKRDEILSAVWGQNDFFTGRSLDVFISKLRKYLNKDPAIKIESIPRVGLIMSVRQSG